MLLLSGVAALVYQTLWVKLLGLVVGVDVYAVTIVLSAFFAGLAGGGVFFGKRADTGSHPLKLVAGLEVAIACLGTGTTWLLASLPGFYVSWLPAGKIVPFLLVGAPAFLMGGTLPALIRAIAPERDTLGKTSGSLYAANTAGAILGALSVPLLLIPQFGVKGSSFFASALNMAVALTALALRARSVKLEASVPAHPERRIGLVCYGVAGGLALGYEVVWSQMISPFLSTRSSAFAVMLATYLTGLAIGSFLYSRVADKVGNRWAAFGYLIASAGLSALSVFVMLGPWLIYGQDTVGQFVFASSQSNLLANSARFIFTSSVVLLLPTLFLGAAFPAAAALVARPDAVGRDIGSVAGANLLGGIVGTLGTGFLLIPGLGLAWTLALLACCSVLLGSFSLYRGSRGFKSVLVLLAAFGLVFSQVRADHMATLLAEHRGGDVVFYRESPAGAVAVLEQDEGKNRFRRLYIQGVSNSGDAFTSLRYMRLQALLPLLIHNGEPESVLVIGMGTGITTGALLNYPLKERVVAELLPEVLEATALFQGNYGVGAEPRVDKRLRDGRHELLASEQKYDLITLEPPPPSAAGIVNLYSRDFYELASMRLKHQGLVAQWWPLPTQNDEESRSLVKSFIEVFPYANAWTTELHEVLLIGSNEPIELDYQSIRSRFETENVKECLGEAGVRTESELLATYVTGRRGLSSYAGDALPVTDDDPRIEYAGWVRKGEFPRVLMELSDLLSPIPLTKASPREARRIEEARQDLWALYGLGYYAYTGEREEWQASLSQLSPEMRSNPYFLWFMGK